MYGIITEFKISKEDCYLNIFIKCEKCSVIIIALDGIVDEDDDICGLQLANLACSEKSEAGLMLELQLHKVVPYVVCGRDVKVLVNNMEYIPEIKWVFTRHSYLEPINTEIQRVDDEIKMLTERLVALKNERVKIKASNYLDDDREWAFNLRCEICGNVPRGAAYLNIGCKMSCGLNKRYCIGCVQDKYVKVGAKSMICSCNMVCLFGDKMFYVDNDCNQRLDEVYEKVRCSRGCGKLLLFAEISNHVLRECVNVDKKMCGTCDEIIIEDSLWLHGHGCDYVH
jgi:hypothetical protein